MVCPACGLPNDPAALTCVRCHAGLTAFTPPSRPAGPAPPPPPPPPAGRSRLPWIAGGAVLVILVAVAGIVVALRHDPEASPAASPAISLAPPAGVRDQLAVIDKVLTDSARSRRKLNLAIEKVNQCRDLDRAVADMTAVGDERQAQLDTVGGAALDQVPDGERLREQLTTALQRALDADQGYLGWARPAREPGCAATAARDAAYARGGAASRKAGAAKAAFLASWNPLAGRHSFPSRTRDDI